MTETEQVEANNGLENSDRDNERGGETETFLPDTERQPEGRSTFEAMTETEQVEANNGLENSDRDNERGGETETFLPDTERQPEGEGARKDSGEGENMKDYNLFKRLRLDKQYRRRFIHTMWLFWAFIGLGWTVGQMGPSFPDLRLIVDQELDVASWLFTSFSFGYLLGSLLGGWLYDHFNKLLLIFFSCVLMAVGSAALPWSTSFPLMIVIRVITGIGAGGLDTGGNADLMALWDEEGRPFMQALHFCFGFGGIISPLVTKPFLAEKTCVPIPQENTTSHYLFTNSTQTTTTMAILTNSTMMPATCQEQFGETHVHISYMITGILVLTTSVPFFVMFLMSVLKGRDSHDMKADKGHQARPDKLPLPLKVIMLVLLVCLMTMYCAVEDTFAGFLMTFSLNHLKWTKAAGSYATSLFWTCFAIGRFSGVLLIKKFKPVQLLFFYCIMLICSFIGFLLVNVTMTEDLVLVFVALAGFSMSVIFACIFQWTEESILEVTGMISAMFLMAASTGLLLNPLFIGFLMDNYAPITFAYVLLAESCCVLMFFLVIFFLVKKFVKTKSAPLSLEMEWTEESILEVTGMISAMFLMAASTGLLLNPLFIGFLMDNYAPITFAYILLAESCCVLMFFLVIFFLVKKVVKTKSAPLSLEMEVSGNSQSQSGC